MPITFFEGFNNLDNDFRKLDETYWTISNSDDITMSFGRTNNQVLLKNRPIASGLQHNTVLTLSNFIDPLVSNSGFSIGFWTDIYTIRTNNMNSAPPHTENFIAFYNGANEVLRIDIIKTTYESTPSIAFGIYQNNTLIDFYDLKNVDGYTWTFGQINHAVYLNEDAYIEIYIDPKNNEEMAIQFTSSNTYDTALQNSGNNIYTSINGFNNLTSIKFYGNNDLFGSSSHRKSIDDLYICGGNNASNCLLGRDTKIYRLNMDGDTATQEWLGSYGGSISSSTFTYLTDDDADLSINYSSTSGDKCLFTVEDGPLSSPENVSGIKLSNVVRKNWLANSLNLVNIVASGNNSLPINCGNTYVIDSNTYSTKSQFIFINPLTGSGWTKDDINNLEIGLKHLG